MKGNEKDVTKHTGVHGLQHNREEALWLRHIFSICSRLCER
jgi:hypothetical protein